ncbi:DNA-binding protein [Hasllibacter halocynthiae]|uniref:DNA-binding protein n=1 Tax=Hasllibacter halocynthiae TaxID=595589 RepID=A0A2T0X7M8_9RHOB|nr:HU family DNA-binding protein [Hasllibacter halocynthiae]PRY94936.1 DNA-binding protein [Hasllibacter halocynthiae]
MPTEEPAAPAEDTIAGESRGAPGSADSTESPEAPAAAALLGRKQLIERAVARSGLKRKDVRPAVEAALAVMGDALAAGEGLNLPPLGKLRVQRRKAVGNGEVLIARIRRKDAPASAPASAAAAPETPAG